MSITTLSRRYRGLLVSVFSIGLFLILTPTVLAAPTDSCGSANDGKFVQTKETTTRGSTVTTYVKWQCGYVTAGRGGQFSWTEAARQSTPFDGIPYDGSGGGGGVTPDQCTSKGGSCSATCTGTSLGTCQDGTTCCQSAAGGGITPAQCTSKGGSCSNTCNGTSLGTCQDGTTCCQTDNGGGGGGGGVVAGSIGSGFVPCGGPPGSDDPETTDSDESSICTLCHLVVMVKRIVDWVIKIMTFFAITIIVAMGILYIVSAGSESLIKIAKEGIKGALYGFGIVLLAWLVVNVILWIVAKNMTELGVSASGWFEFSCSTQSSAASVSFGQGGGYGSPNPPTGPGGTLDCKSGRCANKSDVVAAVKSNAYGVDPNILMSIIDAGEGCNKSLSTDGYGSCGYSQALPSIRTKCGITGTASETCKKIQNDVQLDVNCAAWLIKDNAGRCGMDIRNVASCYNSGKPNNCARTTKNYCGRVETYFNSCK